METLHPGIYIFDKKAEPTIEGVGVSACGIVGAFQKGPTDKPGFVTSWEAFKRGYGSYYKNLHAPIAVKAYFDQGGTKLYVGRVAGTGAAQADVSLKDSGKVANTLKIAARNQGAWGNFIEINTIKAESTTTAALNTAAVVEIPVTSALNFEKGDVCYITDGTNSSTFVVYEVDYANNKLKIKSQDFSSNVIVSGAVVKTSSRHRVVGTIAEALENGDTNLSLSKTDGLYVGSLITIITSTDLVTLEITSINGNSIGFAAYSGSTIASGSDFVSQEFNIDVYDGEVIVETHEFLSMIDNNENDYVEKKLYGDSNTSNYIECTDLDTTNTNKEQHIPIFKVTKTGKLQPLSGGLDGSTPGDTDYKGTQAPDTGIHLFDRIDDITTVCIPGITSVGVIQYGITWARNHKYCMFLAEVPEAYEYPTEAREFRLNELNVDDRFGALYYPWLKIDHPTIDKQIVTQPPTGHVLGVHANVAATRGVFKAPANESLYNIRDLTYKVTDPEQDILNPIGVNAIRVFKGLGVRVYGARTLQNIKDGYHYINVVKYVNYVQQSIVEDTRDLPFEPNNEDLWESIENRVYKFLLTEWKNGALYPRSDAKKAFFVKCNAETNIQATIDQGKAIGEIGINPVKPAEFIIFNFALWDGGAEFTS